MFAVYKRKLEGGEKTLVTVTSYGMISFMTTDWNHDNDDIIKMLMPVRTTMTPTMIKIVKLTTIVMMATIIIKTSSL